MKKVESLGQGGALPAKSPLDSKGRGNHSATAGRKSGLTEASYSLRRVYGVENDSQQGLLLASTENCRESFSVSGVTQFITQRVY